jgi:hypothetical protein
MKSVRAWLGLLTLGIMLPIRLPATFVVTDYDGQTDWVRHDFVGWVRVEQSVKPAKFAKGTAAVTLKVIEKLTGDETSPTLTLEYPVRPAPDELVLGSKHHWNEDLPEHREYLVFLERLPNGAYWCGDQREFPVRGGLIVGLPGAYGTLVGGDTSPRVTELISRARAMLPALRVRTGRPGFAPPLVEKGKPVETPQQGYERIRAVLQTGDQRELGRLIHSPDGAPPKGLQALLHQEREKLLAWPVRWQAVLEDKAVVILGPPGETGTPLYLVRRGPRWHLLNTSPDTELGRQQLTLLLTESQFAILTAMLEREYRGVEAAP